MADDVGQVRPLAGQDNPIVETESERHAELAAGLLQTSDGIPTRAAGFTADRFFSPALPNQVKVGFLPTVT